jgi:hypothetical protein
MDKQAARWAGKRYLVLIDVGEVAVAEPFRIDKREFGNMDDWSAVEEIGRVRVVTVEWDRGGAVKWEADQELGTISILNHKRM